MDSSRAPHDSLGAAHEADLIASAQMGDRVAFLELVRHYQRPLYRLIFAMTRSEARAEALALDVFTRAWKDIAEYPSGRKFFPWLIRITRNVLPREPYQNAKRAREDLPPAAVDALRLDDRMALALRVVERLRYSEIAALLDVPTGLVTLRIAQARGSILASAANMEGAAL